VLAAAASIGVGPRRLAGRSWMSPGWSKKTLAPPAASASAASPIQASRRGRRAIAGFSLNGYLISICSTHARSAPRARDTSGATRSRVVSPINRHRRALPKRGAKNQRSQVCLRIMVLADLSVRIRTRRVEVPQANGFDPVSRIEIFEHALHHPLARSVRVDGVLRMRLLDGQAL